MKKTNQTIQDAYDCLDAGGRVWHGGYPVKIDSWDDKMVFVDCVYDGDAVIINKDNLTGWVCEWSDEEETTVDPGEGYRLLDYGERIKKGDEILCYEELYKVELPSGCVVGDGDVYRRKIANGKAFGEVLSEVREAFKDEDEATLSKTETVDDIDGNSKSWATPLGGTLQAPGPSHMPRKG